MIQLNLKSTEASTHDFYFHPEHIGCALVVDGALGEDTIAINYLGLDGVTATPVTDSAGDAVTLSASNAAYPIQHAQHIQIVKGETTAAVGVNIHGLG